LLIVKIFLTARTGEKVYVNLTGGGKYLVEIPAGARPGQELSIDIDNESSILQESAAPPHVQFVMEEKNTPALRQRQSAP
jgi:hypothetical protein